MKCPKCDGQLRAENYQGLLINRCDKCSGIWLNYPELEELEDKIWSDEELKGTLEFNPVNSTLNCPQCNSLMTKFNYRYSDLIIDTCPNMHGFWLDSGEEKRVEQLMKEDKAAIERKIHVENQWGKHLAFLHSPTFMNKVRDLFNI
jgi:Zn-finger nucleic acid-binding protein